MAIAADNSATSSIHIQVESLFVAHVDAVFNVAYRVLWNRSDAEDVVQATFVKALTRLKQLREIDRARPWLLQVSYREAIDVLRHRRDAPISPFNVPELADIRPGPSEQTVSLDVKAMISRALNALEPNERLAIVLRDVEELPMKEVANILGIGLSAAKMRVHRGRQLLRTTLEAMEVR